MKILISNILSVFLGKSSSEGLTAIIILVWLIMLVFIVKSESAWVKIILSTIFVLPFIMVYMLAITQ